MSKQQNTVILFNQDEVRRIWNDKIELWYFSVIDVIAILTESTIPKRYWTDLKRKLITEGSELYEKIVQLKLQKMPISFTQNKQIARQGDSIAGNARKQIEEQSEKKVISITKKVLVTGVFDVLHQEHIVFLEKAKLLGTYLIVGIESDVRVRQMKGEDRPVFSQEQRKKKLKALGIADEVFILPEQFSRSEDHLALIQKVRPDYLAVSSHTKHLDEKRAILKQCGGEVVIVHAHNPNISTTQLLQK